MNSILRRIHESGRMPEMAHSGDAHLVTQCGHETRESAERSVEALRKYLPDVRCEVIEGECPAYV
jgi:hypothetical protein